MMFVSHEGWKPSDSIVEKDGRSHLVTDDQSYIPPHPLRTKPLGNRFYSNVPDARQFLGVMQALPDEMLMQLLEFLDQRTLRLLGSTCRFLYAHCRSDDLWKSIFLE